MPNKLVDLNGGLDANGGSIFRILNKTLSSAAAVAAAGDDTIRVIGRPSTSCSTAIWNKSFALVTLPAAMNQPFLWRWRLDSLTEKSGRLFVPP